MSRRSCAPSTQIEPDALSNSVPEAFRVWLCRSLNVCIWGTCVEGEAYRPRQDGEQMQARGAELELANPRGPS